MLTRATDWRETASICVKMPPMNIVVPSDANAMDRTVSLADGSHVGSSAPVDGSSAARWLRAAPSTVVNAPPT